MSLWASSQPRGRNRDRREGSGALVQVAGQGSVAGLTGPASHEAPAQSLIRPSSTNRLTPSEAAVEG